MHQHKHKIIHKCIYTHILTWTWEHTGQSDFIKAEISRNAKSQKAPAHTIPKEVDVDRDVFCVSATSNL